jgi:hypothetical protein
MDIDIEKLKLLVLVEINQVIRQKESDKKKTLTVGDVMEYVNQAIINVDKAEKLKSRSSTP